jgi:hypothetical protein
MNYVTHITNLDSLKQKFGKGLECRKISSIHFKTMNYATHITNLNSLKQLLSLLLKTRAMALLISRERLQAPGSL